MTHISGEIAVPMKRVWRCGERDGEVWRDGWGSVERDGEVWRGMGRCGEGWGGVERDGMWRQ